MRRLVLLLTTLFCLSTSGVFAADEDVAPDRYYIPPPQFNAAMEVMDLGFANIFGLFRNATGSFEFEPATKSVGNLKIAIDTTSLMTNNPENERDLEALLDAMEYPEMRFVTRDSISFAEGKADIKGTLTLHGVSKPLVLEATLNHIGKSPQGGSMWGGEGKSVGLSLRGNFKRADFNMADNPEIRSRFGDTITLLLETQAIRQ
jgi:polyisoprenoid-binding protein YceI